MIPTFILFGCWVRAEWTDAPLAAADVYGAAFMLCWMAWDFVGYHKKGWFK